MHLLGTYLCDSVLLCFPVYFCLQKYSFRLRPMMKEVNSVGSRHCMRCYANVLLMLLNVIIYFLAFVWRLMRLDRNKTSCFV